MKIAVIGAGIAGISSALQLAQDGHAVEVFDQGTSAAGGDSFATAGLVSPGLINPWSLPHWAGSPSVSHLLGRGRIALRALPSWSELRWLRTWSRAKKHAELPAAFDSLQRLMAWSQEQLQATSAAHRLEYERAQGTLLLVPSVADHKRLQAGLARLKELGLAFKELTPEEARLVEPGLGHAVTLHSAIHLPGDELVNCRQYALLLRDVAANAGVRFHFNAEVTGLQASGRHRLAVAGWSEHPEFDAVVLCPGAEPLPWAAALGIRLPGTLVHGYTLSAALREPLHAPRSAVVAMDSGIVLSRQGMRLRVAGGAEIGPRQLPASDRAVQSLFQALHHYFPGSPNLAAGTQTWRGSRAFAPDGLPLVGPSAVKGIWLNAAHGANGLALSAGCARLLADQIAGRNAELDAQALLPARFAS